MLNKKTDARIREMAAKEHWETPRSLNRRMETIFEELDARENGCLHGEAPGKVKENQRKRLPGRRMVLAAAALAAVLGITAAASELFDWNPQAVKHFSEPAKEEQDQMTMEGLAVEQNASVTDQGITVTAEQVVQDQNCLYILLDIQAEKNIIDGNGGFFNEKEDGDIFVLETSDPDAFNNSSWAFAPDTPSFEELSDHGYYEIFAMKTPGREWNEESVTVHFTEYAYYTYENGETVPHTIEGDWKLTLPLGSQNFAKERICEPKEPIEIKGVPIRVKEIRLSSLSMTVVFDMDDYEHMWETLYPDQEEGTVLELQLTGFRLTDGSEIPCGAAGMTGSHDYENREIAQHMTLSRYVDADQVEAVLFSEEHVPVALD